MNKTKSPLKDTGGNQGHMLMTKEAHISAHGGDAIAAGYEEETKKETKEESKIPAYEFKIPTKKEEKKKEETDLTSRSGNLTLV